MWLDEVRRADRWRRRLRTLGALTTLLAMAGCSIGAPPSPADDAADNHLTVWVMQDDLSEQTLDAITARFTKTSGATVDVQIQPWDGIATKLTTALVTTDPPDVIDIGNTKATDFASYGALADLSDQADRLSRGKHWLPGLEDPVTLGGRLYGVPAFGATRAVIVNMRMWRQAGITEIPETMDELERDLKTVADAHHDQADFCPFYLPGQHWFAGLQFVWDAGGDAAMLNDGQWRGGLSSKNAVTGLERFKAFQNAWSTEASRTVDTTNPDMVQLFVQGKTSAILWNSTAVTKILASDAGLGRDDLAVFPMPGENGGIQPSLMAGSVWAVPTRSRHRELALEWIMAATDPDIQRQWIADHDNWLPNTTELLDELIADASIDDIQRGFLTTARQARATPKADGWSLIEGDGSLKQLFTAVATGRSTIEQASRSFDRHADDVFEQAKGA